MGFLLQPDLSYCIANGHVILLDIRADRYFALRPEQDIAFQAIASQGSATDIDRRTIAALLKSQVLIETAAPTKLFMPAQNQAPTHSALDDISKASDNIAALQALASLLITRLRFRLRSFQQIVTSLQHHVGEQGGSPASTLAIPSSVISAFLSTRRLIRVRDQCLVQSVACVTYLAALGHAAHLVLGVRSTPFEAHAWAQAGDTVLNDTLDNVRPYTPILVI